MADHSMVRGDTKYINIPVTQPNGTAYNLTGCSLWFTVKRHVGDVDALAVFQLTIGSGIAILSAAGGTAQVTITPALTASLVGNPDRLVYDVQLKSSTNEVFTIEQGTLTVKAGVTLAS